MRVVIKKDSGLYDIYSTVVDDWLYRNITKAAWIKIRLSEVIEKTVNDLLPILDDPSKVYTGLQKVEYDITLKKSKKNLKKICYNCKSYYRKCGNMVCGWNRILCGDSVDLSQIPKILKDKKWIHDSYISGGDDHVGYELFMCPDAGYSCDKYKKKTSKEILKTEDMNYGYGIKIEEEYGYVDVDIEQRVDIESIKE